MVMSEEYPIKGGNDTTNIIAQSISQPAGMFLHFSAAGRRAWNILSLYTKNSIPNTSVAMPANEKRTFFTGDNLSYKLMYFLLSVL